MPRKILVTPVRPRRIEPIASLVETKPFAMNAGNAATSHPQFDTARTPMLTSSAAAAWLGCETSLFVSLQAHGLVTPTYGNGGWRHAFERGQLDDLLTRLLTGAEVVEGITDAVSITEAANRCSCAPVEIIHLLAGELSWKGRCPTGNGIASLLIRTGSIRQLMEKQDVPGPTIREAVVETGVKPEVLASLIGMGAMATRTAVDALTQSPVEVIHQASSIRFFEDYVDVDDVAVGFGQSVCQIAIILSENGIAPIFNDIKLRKRYFRHSDICKLIMKLEDDRIPYRRRDRVINWLKIQLSISSAICSRASTIIRGFLMPKFL